MTDPLHDPTYHSDEQRVHYEHLVVDLKTDTLGDVMDHDVDRGHLRHIQLAVTNLVLDRAPVTEHMSAATRAKFQEQGKPLVPFMVKKLFLQPSPGNDAAVVTVFDIFFSLPAFAQPNFTALAMLYSPLLAPYVDPDAIKFNVDWDAGRFQLKVRLYASGSVPRRDVQLVTYTLPYNYMTLPGRPADLEALVLASTPTRNKKRKLNPVVVSENPK